jgi:hypothetical protein
MHTIKQKLQRGVNLTFGMATGFLYRAPSFLPHARHPSRYSIAGQNVERKLVNEVNRASDPRFPAALSGLGSAVSLSQVGGIRTTLGRELVSV